MAALFVYTDVFFFQSNNHNIKTCTQICTSSTLIPLRHFVAHNRIYNVHIHIFIYVIANSHNIHTRTISSEIHAQINTYFHLETEISIQLTVFGFQVQVWPFSACPIKMPSRSLPYVRVFVLPPRKKYNKNTNYVMVMCFDDDIQTWYIYL